MRKIGRNEPCHCGSGKKYKNCHQQMDDQKGAKNKNFLIGSLIALFILIFAIGLYLNIKSSGNDGPGEAPAGKVWSPEHGHYHNVE